MYVNPVRSGATRRVPAIRIITASACNTPFLDAKYNPTIKGRIKRRSTTSKRNIKAAEENPCQKSTTLKDSILSFSDTVMSA